MHNGALSSLVISQKIEVIEVMLIRSNHGFHFAKIKNGIFIGINYLSRPEFHNDGLKHCMIARLVMAITWKSLSTQILYEGNF